MPPLPWIYSYTIDEAARKDHRDVLRPIIPLRLPDSDLAPEVTALVDSGSDRTIVAPWLGRALGLPPVEPGEGFLLGLGGERQWVRVEQVTLELLHPDGTDSIRWSAEVCIVQEWRPSFAVLLGGRGFFDRFTVTMHRGVQALAIETDAKFEERFGIVIPSEDLQQRGDYY